MPRLIGFTFDSHFLMAIVKSQVGSIDEALLEAIRERIDSGATNIELVLTTDGFTLSDDGKSFESIEEINALFGTIGGVRAIDSNSRPLSGPGQLLALARTQWRSGHYRMTVDIEKQGLAYGRKRLRQHVLGCEVTGQLYQQLSVWSLREALAEIQRSLRYAPVKIRVNGTFVSGGYTADAVGWTHEDDDAWYRLENGAKTLEVHSRGVLVETMPAWRVGRGGVVVSKRLLLTDAKHASVDEDACPVWKRIRARLEELTPTNLLGTKLTTEVKKLAS